MCADVEPPAALLALSFAPAIPDDAFWTRMLSNRGPGERRLVKRLLGEAQNWRCAYCGCVLRHDKSEGADAIAVDELVPIALGGAHSWENVVAACIACNATRALLGARSFFRIRQRWLKKGSWPAGTFLSPKQAARYRIIMREAAVRHNQEAGLIDSWAKQRRRCRGAAGIASAHSVAADGNL